MEWCRHWFVGRLRTFFCGGGTLACSNHLNTCLATDILQMNHFDKDSVLNFLTPTKLVTTSVKGKAQHPPYLNQPSNRPNLNDSLIDPNTNKPYVSNSRQFQPNGQLPTYSFTAHFDKLSRDRSQEGSQVNPSQRSKAPTDRNKLDSSRPILPKEQSFKILTDVRQPPKDLNSSILQVQSLDYAPVGSILAKINHSNVSSREKEVQNYSRVKDQGNLLVQEGTNWGRESGRGSRKQEEPEEKPGRGQSNKNVFKLQGTGDELKQLMAGLRGVKASIESELSLLQKLLDSTSRYLNEINDEYLRIKERILNYTSQVLDASFSRYREQMVNWMKYEEVEKKSIAMVAQLNKDILEDELVVTEITRNAALRVVYGKQQELSQKIDFYSSFHQQLISSRVECLSMRPTLKKDRILDYEKALSAMAEF